MKLKQNLVKKLFFLIILIFISGFIFPLEMKDYHECGILKSDDSLMVTSINHTY